MAVREKLSFGKISKIKVTDNDSWNDQIIFLTFDIDWAHDDIIRDSMQLILEAGAYATFFVTHDTPVLDELRAQSNFELGLHPNFNKILDGTDHATSAEGILKELMTIVPEAKAVRSHSTTFSSQLCNVFAKAGLTHDCNFFIPDFANVELKPWKNWLQMTMVPYFWEDDVACLEKNVAPVLDLVNRKGVRVFDFHPMHVFLNSESMDRYEKTRQYHRDPKKLMKYRFDGYGARSQLKELLGVKQ